jgi:hypothetical protein
MTACLAFLLAGCGGGSEPLESPQSVCVPKASVEVDLVGDSTLAHDNDGSGPDHPGPILRALLAQAFPGRTTVVVLAVPGANSDHVLTQGPFTGDVIYTNLGLVNDAASDLPIQHSIDNMNAFEGLTAGKVVIWATPVAIDPVQWVANGGTTFQSDLEAAAVTSFAATNHQALADIRNYELAIPGWQAMTLDGLHPDPSLYDNLTENVTFPPVRDAVAKLLCQ